MKLLSAIILLSLIGCSNTPLSIRSAPPCKKAVLIPDRWINDREIELLWLEDRTELRSCADKVEVLSNRDLISD